MERPLKLCRMSYIVFLNYMIEKKNGDTGFGEVHEMEWKLTMIQILDLVDKTLWKANIAKGNIFFYVTFLFKQVDEIL